MGLSTLRGRVHRFLGLALCALVTLGGGTTTVWAQESASRRPPVSRRPDRAVSPRDSAPSPSPQAQLEAAYRASRQAESVAELSTVLARLEPLLQRGLSPAHAAYARQLTAWAHHRRGEAQVAAGKAEEALGDFEAALRLDPEHLEARHQRAVSYAEAERWDEARADLDQVLAVDPTHADALFNRAQLRLGQADVAGALGDLDRLLSLRPRDAAAWALRGEAHLAAGELARSVADLDEALRLEPTQPEAFATRAEALLGLGQDREAARDFRAAIRIDPGLGRAYRGAAWLMATSRDEGVWDPPLAVRAARRALELEGDDDPGVYEVLAQALASAGDWDQAVRWQERVVAALGTSGELAAERLAEFRARAGERLARTERAAGADRRVEPASAEATPRTEAAAVRPAVEVEFELPRSRRSPGGWMPPRRGRSAPTADAADSAADHPGR